VVYDSDGRPVAIECIARDVSERRNLEDQVRQSQKMEAIGRMAAGVAHDFNNLLMVIGGYSAHALSVLTETDALYAEIREIRKAGDHAASLTRQLLAFSRREMLRPHVFDLNTTVADMDRMLRRILAGDVELVTILASGLGCIRADRGQIEQVIMNLVVNGRDAMPQGGKLVIETANADRDEPGAGRRVMLAVSDTGQGMDEGTRARIFEPFFTTKPRGEGTGLGLSMVYSIVKQSGGNIQVESELGKGTAFRIFFPAAAKGTQTGEHGQ
jgi:signal transduction histidine kinase